MSGIEYVNEQQIQTLDFRVGKPLAVRVCNEVALWQIQRILGNKSLLLLGGTLKPSVRYSGLEQR